MKLVNRSRTGKILKIIKEINTIKELETYIKEPKDGFSHKTINDFIKFSNNDYEYLLSLIQPNNIFSQSQLMWQELSKKVFKYRFKSQRQYWLCRGWNEDDTTIKVSEYQSTAGKACSKVRFNSPKYKESLPNCKEYWIKRGFSELESIQKVKERQSTFTLAKCIKRHGKEAGEKRFNDRQTKWINSLYDGKTDEEIIAFEKSKMIDFCKASKESLKVFIPLLKYIKQSNIIKDDSQYYIGYENKKEYFLYNKDHQILFFYDFVIPHLKIIIEFNGHVWHSTGDSWKPLNHVDQSKEQIVNKEKLKEDTAIQSGFKLLKIWDTETPELNLQKCIDFIKKYNLFKSPVYDIINGNNRRKSYKGWVVSR